MGVQAGRGQVTRGHSDKLGFLLRALRSHSRFWALRGSQTRVRDQGGVGEASQMRGQCRLGRPGLRQEPQGERQRRTGHLRSRHDRVVCGGGGGGEEGEIRIRDKAPSMSQ